MRQRIVLVAAALFTLVLPGCGGPAPTDERAETRGPTVRVNGKIDGKADVAIDVTGLDAGTLDRLVKAKLDAAGWAEIFSVTVNGKLPAVAGTHRIADGVLRFEPRFPLVPGVRYHATFNPAKLPGATGGKPVVEEFGVAKPPPKATASLVQIYPTRNTLPENQLKLYLHFSAPMSRGEAYARIRLLKADGKAVEKPFLELDEELWDPEGKRFTLFFDPGRIKRGLKPRELFGPALEEGKSYTVVVDREWPDADGNPLKAEFRKSFRVLAPDDTQPDVKDWKLQPPAAGSLKPLAVTFPEPLDHGMLMRVVSVDGPDGKTVAGKVEVTGEETRWQFTPEKAWAEGEHNLLAETILEDLAGNSLARPFEVDVFRPVQRQIEVKTVKVPFRVSR